MLQDLEAANRHTKLLTRAAIFNRRIIEHFHVPNGFSAYGGNAVINPLFENVETGSSVANYGIATDGDIFQNHFAGASSINGRIILRAHAVSRFIDYKQANTVPVALITGNAGRNNQLVCPRAA